MNRFQDSSNNLHTSQPEMFTAGMHAVLRKPQSVSSLGFDLQQENSDHDTLMLSFLATYRPGEMNPRPYSCPRSKKPRTVEVSHLAVKLSKLQCMAEDITSEEPIWFAIGKLLNIYFLNERGLLSDHTRCYRIQLVTPLALCIFARVSGSKVNQRRPTRRMRNSTLGSLLSTAFTLGIATYFQHI
jgi:hypothetical protein